MSDNLLASLGSSCVFLFKYKNHTIRAALLSKEGARRELLGVSPT